MKASKKSYFIPKEDLPEGIFLCLNNCDRHREDATALASKNRYNSAVVSLYVAIEEFAKAVWLTSCLSKANDLEDKEGKFLSHKFKQDLFFEYVKKIENYQSSSGKNEFVKMADLITDDQEYKLKMLYVDYNGKAKKSKYWNSIWWDPNYILQLAQVGEYNTNLPLSTKYEELKKDLEFAVAHFRKSELFRFLRKFMPRPLPETMKTLTFIESHFLLEKAINQLSGYANYNSIEVFITPNKNETWVDDTLMSIIESDLKKFYTVKNDNISAKIFKK